MEKEEIINDISAKLAERGLNFFGELKPEETVLLKPIIVDAIMKMIIASKIVEILEEKQEVKDGDS